MHPLSGLSALFRAAVAIRTTLYERGVPAVHRVGVPVICAGNIAVGGRGKSPLAMHLAGRIATAGIPVALLLRGYGGTMERGGGLVSDGDGPRMEAASCGDEAWQAARLCPGIVVRVGANRVRQARQAVADGARAIVLDDGFQHLRLFRDLDIVCIDPSDVSPDRALLPRGHLREDVVALRRAGLLAGWTGAWQNQPHPPPLLFSPVSDGLETRDGKAASLPAGSPVHGVCGIAHPVRFFETLAAAGLHVVSQTVFADHHRYSAADVNRFCAQAQQAGALAIVTTMKDVGKLAAAKTPVPLLALRIRLSIDAGEAFLDEHLRRMGLMNL